MIYIAAHYVETDTSYAFCRVDLKKKWLIIWLRSLATFTIFAIQFKNFKEKSSY